MSPLCRFSSVRFVDISALQSATAGSLEAAQFEAIVRQQCAQARDVLQNKLVIQNEQHSLSEIKSILHYVAVWNSLTFLL